MTAGQFVNAGLDRMRALPHHRHDLDEARLHAFQGPEQLADFILRLVCDRPRQIALGHAREFVDRDLQRFDHHAVQELVDQYDQPRGGDERPDDDIDHQVVAVRLADLDVGGIGLDEVEERIGGTAERRAGVGHLPLVDGGVLLAVAGAQSGEQQIDRIRVRLEGLGDVFGGLPARIALSGHGGERGIALLREIEVAVGRLQRVVFFLAAG